MKTLRWTALVLAGVLLTAAAAFAGAAPWKIGALLCLSGPCAQIGESSLKGAQIAIEEINQAGGILGRQVELVTEDTQEALSGARTVSAFQKLRTDPEMHFILGPTWTPGGLSVAPLAAKQSDLILISPSLGAREFNKTGANIFNSWGTDEAATRKTAQYAFAQGLRKVAIFSSQHPWDSEQGRYFKDEFEKLGGRVPVIVEPIPALTDLKAEALKVVTAKPDGLFFSCYVQMPLAAREVRALNYSGPKFAALIENTLTEAAQGALAGTVFFSLSTPKPAFSEKLRARYGAISETHAAIAYDTINIYADALKKAGAFDQAKIESALINTPYPGVSGLVRFDAEGCAQRDLIPWTVKHDTVAELKP